MLGHFSAIAQSVRIDGVRVLGPDFKEIATLREPDELRSLEELWAEMTLYEEDYRPKWTYKLDIDSEDIGGRWLYSSEGYITRLTMNIQKTYRVSDKEAFNRLLGL